MKGGKEEEEKNMGPLFPRLHVNDADKGGPRAPPRNKMALYEQLSIPSQRFKHASASTLTLPPYNAGSSAPSASSSQGGGQERSVFSPLYVPQSPAHSTEIVPSQSLDGRNPSSIGMEFGRSLMYAQFRSSNAAGSVAECSSLRLRGLSGAQASCKEKVDAEDDFRVPTFVHSEIDRINKYSVVMDKMRLTPLFANRPRKSYPVVINSIQSPNSYKKRLEQSNTDMELSETRKHEKSYTEQMTKESAVFNELVQKTSSHLETGDKEASNSTKADSDRREISANIAIRKTCHGSIGSHQEPGDNEARDQPVFLSDTEIAENEDALRVGSESFPKGSFGNNHRGSELSDNCNVGNDHMTSGSLELEHADKGDEVSETSMVDYISGLEISPDDVVGIIGPKQFWKARRAIVNQQRIFAVQVLELHRLIKVQKLISASPHLLLEDNPYLSGSSQKVPDKKLPLGFSSKTRPENVKQKVNNQKLNPNMECQTENIVVPPVLSHNDVLNNGFPQLPSHVSYSGNLPLQVPVAPDINSSPWCYPSANHWLVPVMSSSEGLIYKPYTGPCPPAAGFMGPVYGNSGNLGIPPGAGDLTNVAYGVSHQQQNMTIISGARAIGSNYFTNPYGVPFVNPNMPSSAVGQVSPVLGPRPTGQVRQHSRSSCNMTIPRHEPIPACYWKLHTSKDSELQGSTASSPSERVQGEGRDVLPLFPVAPVGEGSGQRPPSHVGDHQARVIKVVPHNARSATESAARIFRSIQEERQHHDL